MTQDMQDAPDPQPSENPSKMSHPHPFPTSSTFLQPVLQDPIRPSFSIKMEQLQRRAQLHMRLYSPTDSHQGILSIEEFLTQVLIDLDTLSPVSYQERKMRRDLVCEIDEWLDRHCKVNFCID